MTICASVDGPCRARRTCGSRTKLTKQEAEDDDSLLWGTHPGHWLSQFIATDAEILIK